MLKNLSSKLDLDQQLDTLSFHKNPKSVSNLFLAVYTKLYKTLYGSVRKFYISEFTFYTQKY